jgi:hypothetical protein
VGIRSQTTNGAVANNPAKAFFCHEIATAGSAAMQ